MVNKESLKLIVESEIDIVNVRSAMTCRTASGVCQSCYGMDLSTRKLVEM